MKYKLLHAHDLDSLEHKVQSHIILGWLPSGGIAIDSWTRKEPGSREVIFEYCQAMILKEDGDRS